MHLQYLHMCGRDGYYALRVISNAPNAGPGIYPRNLYSERDPNPPWLAIIQCRRFIRSSEHTISDV